MLTRIALSLAILLFWVPEGTAYAGLLSSEPPAEFMNQEFCETYSTSSCTLKDFVTNEFPEGAAKKWAKGDGSDWVFSSTRVDPVSGANGRVAFSFYKTRKNDQDFIAVSRLVMDNKEIFQQYVPNIMIGIVQGYINKMGLKPNSDFVQKMKNEARASANSAAEEQKRSLLAHLAGNYKDQGGTVKATIEPSGDSAIKITYEVSCNDPAGTKKTLVDPAVRLSANNFHDLVGTFSDSSGTSCSGKFTAQSDGGITIDLKSCCVRGGPILDRY